ncbi:unnamed protein product [Urochloa decumbens]|uniref:NAC domain-containing protein n=1 Tax=Urochloa decumbens TaxID=240449 RepID=A0ABC9B361_9POAL
MALRLPIVSAASLEHEPGFRFTPTDEDIVAHYLRPRAVNEPPPSANIVDMDILSYNPWDLVPEGSKEKYFFSQRVLKWPLGSQWNRAAGDGYWKTSGKDVPIFSCGVNGGEPLMIGLKRTLVFYHGKSGAGENTEWVMQEYRLAGAGLRPYHVMRPSGNKNSGESSSGAAIIRKVESSNGLELCAPKRDLLSVSSRKNDNASEALNSDNVPVMVKPDETWVVCRIYKKRKHTPRVTPQVYNIAQGRQVPFYNFLDHGNSKGTSIPLEKTKDDKEG